MSGRELDVDGTDTFHPQHPWEQAGHPQYVAPGRRNSANWPPEPAEPAGPAERERWGSLPLVREAADGTRYVLEVDVAGRLSLRCMDHPYELLLHGAAGYSLARVHAAVNDHERLQHRIEEQPDLPIGPPRPGMDSLLRRFGHPPVQREAPRG